MLELVEQADAVTEAAATMQGDNSERRVVDGDIFRLGDIPEVLDNVFGRDGAEIKTLDTRQDGSWQFVGIGGSKDENNVSWRFFEGF